MGAGNEWYKNEANRSNLVPWACDVHLEESKALGLSMNLRESDWLLRRYFAIINNNGGRNRSVIRSFDTVAIKYNTIYSRQKLQNLYKTIWKEFIIH
jgi:hypothetical protein